MERSQPETRHREVERGSTAPGAEENSSHRIQPGSCCHRTRERSPEEYRALMNRLSRIEGQVRGVRRMLEENAYCPDILTQVSAVNSALNSFSRELLSQHIRTCVKDDILGGNDDTLDELMETLRRLMK